VKGTCVEAKALFGLKIFKKILIITDSVRKNERLSTGCNLLKLGISRNIAFPVYSLPLYIVI
jgi:hypothetical protein